MEKQNKKCLKNIGTYFIIVIFTMILNALLYFYATWHFISDIGNYLSDNISFLHIKKPIFFEGLFRVIVLDLTVNLFFLLLVEFVIIWVFCRQLNGLFKINNLFTTKKIIWLAVIIMGIHLIFSCWIWKSDPQTREIHPVETDND